MKDAFSSYHPLVNFLYFALVLVFTMVFTHPVCLAISMGCAFWWSCKLGGRKALRFNLLALLPMPTVLFLAVPYLFFSVIWVIKPNRIRSIVAFAVFAVAACTYYTVIGLRSVGMGCGLIAGIAIVRHLDREKLRRIREGA